MAFVLAAGLQDWIDLGVIAGLLLLNAVVGFVQDYQAGNIVKELKKTLAQKCAVLRNGGILAEVDVPSLVPGDIVHLDEVRSDRGSSILDEIHERLTLAALGHHCTSGRCPNNSRGPLAGRSILSHRRVVYYAKESQRYHLPVFDD